MKIKRDLYLNKLIRSMHNGMIKVGGEWSRFVVAAGVVYKF